MGTNDLFVVCDGLGGLFNGALVSKTALDSIIADFTMMSSVEPETHLQSAMQKTQNAVIKTNPKPLSTSVVALYLVNGTAYTAWCRDSRIYHFRDNLLFCISRDHNVLQNIIHAIINNSTQDGSNLLKRKLLTEEIDAPDNFTWYIVQI